MYLNLALALFVLSGIAVLYRMARRDDRQAAARRARLLDQVAAKIHHASISLRQDGYPVLIGKLADGRSITIELIADTLVFRRLPQLWLIVTISEPRKAEGLSVGGLARPTGAEFYSWVIELPITMEPPQDSESAILLRCDGEIDCDAEAQIRWVFSRLFQDSALKEIISTPGTVRVVRQVAEGDRGAHLLARQTRFPIDSINPQLVDQCIADGDDLRQSLKVQRGD